MLYVAGFFFPQWCRMYIIICLFPQGDSTAKLEVSGDSLLDESETSDGEGFSENGNGLF